MFPVTIANSQVSTEDETPLPVIIHSSSESFNQSFPGQSSRLSCLTMFFIKVISNQDVNIVDFRRVGSRICESIFMKFFLQNRRFDWCSEHLCIQSVYHAYINSDVATAQSSDIDLTIETRDGLWIWTCKRMN